MMVVFRTVWRAVLLASLITLCSAAKDQSSDAATLHKFTQLMEEFITDQKILTASAAVMHDGKIIYTNQLDQTNVKTETETERAGNVETDVLDEPRHLEESISSINVHKAHGLVPVLEMNHLITVLGALALRKEGLLDLNQKVFDQNGILKGDFSPNFGDERFDDVRVINLIQQTVGWGIRDMRWQEKRQKSAIPDNDWSFEPVSEVLDRVLAERMMWQPGAAFNYSVVNDFILRRFIGKIAQHHYGQTYEAYVKVNVLQNLGLSHTKLIGSGREPMKDYTMPLLSSVWAMNIQDLSRLLIATDGDGNTLNLDLGILYSRPELPYPQTTAHWHSPTYFLNKKGSFWSESVTSNGHYLFIYHTGTQLTDQSQAKSKSKYRMSKTTHKKMLVLYARGLTHRHFKPILVKMMDNLWVE